MAGSDDLREVLLNCFSTPTREEVTALVPELAQVLKGRKIYIQELTGPERMLWHRENSKKETKGDGDTIFLPEDNQARLVALSLVTEDGEKIFKPTDVPALLKASAMVARLSTIAMRLSSLFWTEETSLKNGHTTLPSNAPRQGEDYSPTSCYEGSHPQT